MRERERERLECNTITTLFPFQSNKKEKNGELSIVLACSRVIGCWVANNLVSESR